ncbi:hypothetical protein HBH56_240940 [Parastagonospora nodorum]|nr:hypothetical protein HBH56_240940 [Parastagonospora nodorum]KAH3968527.1 hypothetical protein HBH52_181190 [Parastagonospora nodorum]KAH4101205.1 hypothetical protein HBH46_143850 [Parastagonospora nodorum]KAH4117996.1 hypothetical protein HBH47_146220 [Parastagonospora nodorum]KAH4146802.1 hypothetical protein HBH44_235150 [Parastagonospora nodorum]
MSFYAADCSAWVSVLFFILPMRNADCDRQNRHRSLAQLLQQLPSPPLNKLIVDLFERRHPPPNPVARITRQLDPLLLTLALAQIISKLHEIIPRLLLLRLLIRQQRAILLIQIIPIVPRIHPLPQLAPLFPALLYRIVILRPLLSFKQLFHARQLLRAPKIPIPLTTPRHLFTILIQHSSSAHIVWPALVPYLALPHVFLAHKLVDFVIEVADLVVGQRLVLDLGHLAADLFEHLAAPFLAHGDRRHGCYEFGASCARDVDDAGFGGLCGAEAEEHRVRLFRVTRHDCGCVGVLWGCGFEVKALLRKVATLVWCRVLCCVGCARL